MYVCAGCTIENVCLGSLQYWQFVSFTFLQLYTVVHNVKMAHEVQESGETQDFIDDIEYLLDNLEDNRSISIRSLRFVYHFV